MNRFFAMAAVSALCAVSTVAQTPEALPYSDYTGDAFTANWQGADRGRLSVFSLDKSTVLSDSQDFSSVVSGGSINTEAIDALRPEWDVQLSSNTAGNVSFVNNRHEFTLDGNGSSVALISRHGFLKTFKVKATLINSEGITEGNASRFTLDILYNDGTRYGYRGAASVTAFANTAEYDFILNFLPEESLSQFCGIRLTVEKDETNNVGDLAIESISYDYYQRDMLVRDMAVSGGSARVEQCDPSKAYFYYLSAADDDSQSRIEVVDGFLLPTLLAPELISSTSYKAKWTSPYKADSITVCNYKVTVFDRPSERFVLDEDFDAATDGTLELPSYTSDLDLFCKTPGWSVAGGAGRTVEGMIGTAASPRPWPPMGGYMYSPALDLSACDGVYKLAFKLYGTPGDIISVYREDSMTPNYQLYGQQFTFDDKGIVEEEYTMDDGVDGKCIRFESKGMKQFFIDYFRVSQEMPAGSKSYDLASETGVSGTDTECTVNGLEENGLYAYGLVLTGKSVGGGIRSISHDEYMHADLATSGVENVTCEMNRTLVTSSPGMVIVASDTDCNVMVYGFDGVSLGSAKVKGGSSVSIPIASGTPVIVRAAGSSVKLIVK